MNNIKALGSILLLPWEYCYDSLRALRWSKASPFSPKDRADYYDIILLAHTVEKGLSQKKPRPNFGREKIRVLLDLLNKIDWNGDRFPIEKSYGALLAYMRWHNDIGCDMGPFRIQLEDFVGKCERAGLTPKCGVKTLQRSVGDLRAAEEFLRARYSSRRFACSAVSQEVLSRVFHTARHAPSQCNRQSTKVHCYSDRQKIRQLLRLQRGASGFEDAVPNLFVVTSDIVAWSGCNARNQAYVDGSLFAMQLMLACQAVGLVSCPLNLAVGNLRERRIRLCGGIPHSERLILMIAFGWPLKEDSGEIAAFSVRLPVESILINH